MAKILTNDILLSCSKLTLRQPKGCEFSLKEWLEANGYCTDCSESGGGGGEILGLNTRVLFFDGDDNPAGEAGLTYVKGTNTLQLGDTLSPAAGIKSYVRIFSAQGNILYFKDNDATTMPNLFVGTIVPDSITTGTSNILIGATAGEQLTTASDNIAIGNFALTIATGGSSIIAIGADAAGNYTGAGNSIFIGDSAGINATGEAIIAIGNGSPGASFTGGLLLCIGSGSGTSTTTGIENTYVGHYTGVDNITATDCSYFGYAAGEHQLGSFNTAVGSGAFKANAASVTNTGENNTVVGYAAGNLITTASSSVLIGANAGQLIATINDIVAIGHNAGAALTNNISSGSSVIIGTNALLISTTCGNNVVIGQSAAANTTALGSDNVLVGHGVAGTLTGVFNVIIGHVAGGLATSADFNVLIGNGIATTLATGDKNTMIGSLADVSTSAITESIAIGYQSIVTANNQCVIGGQVGISAFYLGNGVTSGSPLNTTINATGGSGTDIIGANMTFAAGKPTGAGLGGHLIFQTAPAGASGTTLGTLTTLFEITDDAKIGFYGVTPQARSTGWTITNLTTDKVIDCNSTSVDELADIVGTLITYFISRGDLSA